MINIIAEVMDVTRDAFGTPIELGSHIVTYSREGAKIKFGKVTSVTKRGYVVNVCDIDYDLDNPKYSDYMINRTKCMRKRVLNRRCIAMEVMVITDPDKIAKIDKIYYA